MRRRPEFDRVFRSGTSVSDGSCRLVVAPSPRGPRLGCIVGRRQGNAVRRNRLKRLLREAFRQIASGLGAVDIVAIPRPGAELSVARLMRSWPRLVEKALKRKAEGEIPREGSRPRPRGRRRGRHGRA